MQLSVAQLKQLDDVVKETRIIRGKNAGSRKDTLINIDHFDMRSFNRLIALKLVAPSEYHHDGFYATELGYATWSASTKQMRK
ncbi:hypothetical protein ACN1T8_001358 [Vibrio cholerae]|uniref:hypothetical protein n=1 Tax=Vibrio cholerae TaxID=666 RepID=UPI001C92C0F2|nr:hypothetical protein [Vibrio cholerae]MBY4642004.1 hypothetical protein [Vibrio cholerae]MCR9658276.1 hypothetical protein [Vibrio cholerae]MCR9688957.1 hypothetical protein [Vibrio cholerae]MCR9737465.1 hypothetical protein [Vibrio cholerae]MCR9746288.1 hypothetical protein [Vibrio cholerae]